MNTDDYDDDLALDDDEMGIDVDDDLDFDTGIAGFQIAYGSSNKKTIKRSIKYKQQVREKLDSLSEKRFLDKQINSLSDYWDM